MCRRHAVLRARRGQIIREPMARRVIDSKKRMQGLVLPSRLVQNFTILVQSLEPVLLGLYPGIDMLARRLQCRKMGANLSLGPRTNRQFALVGP